ncbi:MAG: flavodoxin family protein [Chitinispirillaceae bacterium]
MKITVLNGDIKQKKSNFSAFITDLTKKLQQDHSVDLFSLDEMNLHYCTGCWSCWWKTPGRCAISDDAEKIFASVINSDFLLFASPLYAGFTSSALKKITDRLIVLLHPYILIKNGECHHRKRYDTYPDFGVLLEKEKDTDEEDAEIIRNIYDRLAINFHSTNRYVEFTDEATPEEIVHETCHI